MPPDSFIIGSIDVGTAMEVCALPCDWIPIVVSDSKRMVPNKSQRDNFSMFRHALIGTNGGRCAYTLA